MRFLATLLMVLAACAPDGGQRHADASMPADRITRHAWTHSGADAAPGSIRIFTPDGTLLMTSCVETYRLAAWRAQGDSAVVWEEDGMQVTARIDAVDDDEMRLTLQLTGGPEVQRFVPARAPVVCPDLPR